MESFRVFYSFEKKAKPKDYKEFGRADFVSCPRVGEMVELRINNTDRSLIVKWVIHLALQSGGTRFPAIYLFVLGKSGDDPSFPAFNL